MANLTISVDDVLLKRARIKALKNVTSVNALLREYLEAYTGTQQTQRRWPVSPNLPTRAPPAAGSAVAPGPATISTTVRRDRDGTRLHPYERVGLRGRRCRTGQKRERACAVIAPRNDAHITTSSQVLSEFYTVVTRKTRLADVGGAGRADGRPAVPAPDRARGRGPAPQSRLGQPSLEHLPLGRPHHPRRRGRRLCGRPERGPRRWSDVRLRPGLEPVRLRTGRRRRPAPAHAYRRFVYEHDSGDIGEVGRVEGPQIRLPN